MKANGARSYRYIANSHSKLQNSALDRDADGVRPVRRPQLTPNVLDVHLDGAIGGTQAVGDFLVGQTLGHVGENLDFAGRQGDLRKAFAETLGYGRRDHSPAGVNRADG